MAGTKQLRRLIHGVIDAATDCSLVGCQDGGVNVDVVLSRRRGHTNEVMGLEESEERLDSAIRKLWKAITGTSIKGDPFDFVAKP